jgi:hypothetical protein
MTELRGLQLVEFETPAVPASTLGARGELRWIALEKIVIDPAYQRDVGAAGKKNIRQIVERFHWSLFSPLVVAPRGAPRPDAERPGAFTYDKFAAIDGQHRAIAALTHGGIAELPCWVIEVDAHEEAFAFAVINGQVTALNGLHVFRAKVVAGDPAARRVVEVAARAGVVIVRNPTAGAMLKHGETQAPTAIAAALERFGPEVTVAALNCVTKSGENQAMPKEVVISAFSEVMAKAPGWRAHKGLYGALAKVTIKKLYADAVLAQARHEKVGLRRHLVARIEAALTKALGETSFVELPPTPAEIKRKERVEARIAARADSKRVREAAQRRAWRAKKRETTAKPAEKPAVDHSAIRAARMFAAPKTAAKQAKPKQDVRALIDAYIKTKGVKKVPEAVTANPSVLTDYLRGRGFDAGYVAKEQKYRIGKKLYDLKGLIAFAGQVKAGAIKPPAAARLQKAG